MNILLSFRISYPYFITDPYFRKRSNIITISREFGSGGRTIAKAAAQRLGYAFYDKELIEKIAEESGLSREYIEAHGEHAPGRTYFGYAFVGRDAAGNSVGDYLWKV